MSAVSICKMVYTRRLCRRSLIMLMSGVTGRSMLEGKRAFSTLALCQGLCDTSNADLTAMCSSLLSN
jgi:hypothetical protein